MSDSSGGRCNFTFDPVEWEVDTGTTSPLLQGFLNRGEVWQCPHETAEGCDHCLFHLPVEDKDAAAVKEAFLSQIEEEGRNPKQFIGARFGEFTLDHVIVECGEPNNGEVAPATCKTVISASEWTSSAYLRASSAISESSIGTRTLETIS